MLDANAVRFVEKLERYGKIISDDEFSSPAYGLKFSPCPPSQNIQVCKGETDKTSALRIQGSKGRWGVHSVRIDL